ncbi:MAG: hypothetical protein ACR2MM_08730 [Flavobacteriaceae bacterium]
MMKKNYAVPLGLVLLMAITFLCTSYIPIAEHRADILPNPGNFELVVSGNNTLYLKGSVAIEAGEMVSSEGDFYPTLNLKLLKNGKDNGQFLNLYMANPKLSHPLKTGNYAVTENIDGFIRDFKGVFGFADIDHFGELPFFSEQGQITICDTENRRVSGRLQLKLSNSAGEIIEVKGSFVTPQMR